MKKIKEIVLKIWKDPVWSKVISAGILGLIALLWAKLTHHSWNEIYLLIINVLSFKVPIFVTLSVIAVILAVLKGIQYFRRRKDPFWDEPMGNYTFKELYNILLTQRMPATTVGMQISGRAAPNEDLLFLLRLYHIYLNKGIGIADNIQDGGYLYSIFAPLMVGYGLVEVYDKPDDQLPEVTDPAYRTSALGYKFHASLNKLILADDMKKLRGK
jgi:hypothetical protein